MAPHPRQPSSEPTTAMPVGEALAVLHQLRDERQVVVTNQGSAREWPKLSQHPLDFHYIPSAMGGAVPLGLGIALAQPDREVMVLSGDGSLLMNLGSLVSVVDSGAGNFTLVLLDNGVYEITGGQRTPGSAGPTDFAGLARASGFRNVVQHVALATWRNDAERFLRSPGPRFAWLQVHPVLEDYAIPSPGPMSDQLARLTQHLGTAPDGGNG